MDAATLSGFMLLFEFCEVVAKDISDHVMYSVGLSAVMCQCEYPTHSSARGLRLNLLCSYGRTEIALTFHRNEVNEALRIHVWKEVSRYVAERERAARNLISKEGSTIPAFLLLQKL